VGDRLNPVLVKEVRQALRGKMFRISFIVTLTLATLISLGVIVTGIVQGRNEEIGPLFFMPMFFLLVVSLQVVVPFSAFVSMGSEWDENTWDLLVLSDLKPRRILLGKLLAAGTQALLHVSVFVPFLVFAFLLRGLAPQPVLVLIACSLLASAGLCTLALWLSSLTTQRFLRVLLLALLAAALVNSAGGMMVFAGFLTQMPHVLSNDEFRGMLGFAVAMTLLLGGFFFAAGCSRLAHPEENRSSGLRALTTASFVAGLIWLLYMVPKIGSGDPIFVLVSVMIGVLTVPAIIFLTEPEGLGRRVRLDVPRSRVLALLAAPFLPGSGRAMLYLLLSVGLLYLGAFLLFAVHGPLPLGFSGGTVLSGLPGPASEGMSSVFMSALYVVGYLSVLSLAVARLTRTPRGRIIARAILFLAWIPMLALPVLFGFLSGTFDESLFLHAGNPGWVVARAWDGGFPGDVRGACILVGVVAAIGVLLQAPRMVRGVREVTQASARARAAARGARPVDRAVAAEVPHAGARS